MILTKSDPFTLEEIEQLKEEYDIYIKAVIDLENKVCCAGMKYHSEGKQILLNRDSNESHIWGGGLNLITKEIDSSSYINICHGENTQKSIILDQTISSQFEELARFFFQAVLISSQQVLLSSLSQDLYRVANFVHAGSIKSADRFWLEAGRHVKELLRAKNPPHLNKILMDLGKMDFDSTSIEQGELLLTYGLIAQSLAFHGIK